MTERISHEEARHVLSDLRQGPCDWWTRPEQVTWVTAIEGKLRAYIGQQQALEADTVSRAEHEAALQQVREAWAKESKAEKAAHAFVENETEERVTALQAQLTALQAELATERARAEEAESDHRRVTQAFSEAATELAAANARAGRLEDSLAKVMAAVRLTPDKLEEAMRQGQVALSTAPQASTEQASPSPAVGEASAYHDDDHLYPGDGPCNCGGEGSPMGMPQPHIKTCPQHPDYVPIDDEPAQPAPGGTEHVHDDLLMGDRLTCGPCWQRENGCPVCHVKYGYGHHHSCPGADPTPAEPGGTERWVPKVDDVVRVAGIRLRNGSLGTVEGYNSAGDGLWTVQMHEDLQRVRYPLSELEPSDAACPRCHSRNRSERRTLTHRSTSSSFACINDWHDPTPAEPQGRPEQAGDRPVMLSELVKALRWYHNHGSNTHDLADRLERHPESYGAGFAYGMAEMARRIKVGCRTRAKAIEKRRTKKAGKRG